MKKEWEKPVMTVVTKSTTEENVLDTCKGWPEAGRVFGGPGATVPGCWINTENSICNFLNQS